MASRSDIEAGRAHILLYMKNQLGRGLTMVRDQLQGLGSSVMRVGGFLTGLGAGLVAPLVAAVATFSAMGSELADMSARTGVAVGTLAELKFAAEQTGASLAEVEKAIVQQQKKGLGSDFAAVARDIAAIEDPAKRTQAAFEAWGKSGVKLLPMIDNLAALRQEARDLGLVPTEQAVAMADEIGDAVDKIKSVLAATVFEVGAALAPMLLPALETVKNIAGWFNRWAKENGAIIRTVAMIAAGVLAAGVVVTGIGASIFAIGTLFGLAASAVGALGAAIAFLTNPVTLVVAAIVAGVVAWARFSSSGQAAVKAIVDFFLPMIETIRTAIGGIGDALMAGDLELAGRIAVTALHLVFAQGVAQIAALIGGVFGNLFATIGNQLLSGDFAGAWETVAKQIAAVWDQLVAGMLAAFKSLADGVLAIWNGVTKVLSKSMGGLREFLVKHGGQAGAAASVALGAAQFGVANTVGATIDTGLNLVSASAGIGSQAQNQKAAKSAADFAAAIAGGGDQASATAAKLAAELDELRKQAAAAREAAAAGGGALAPEVNAAAIKEAATTVTFSAAGAIAAGQGGGSPAARQLKAAEDGNKKLDVLHQDLISLRDKIVVPVAS